MLFLPIIEGEVKNECPSLKGFPTTDPSDLLLAKSSLFKCITSTLILY